MPYTVKFNPNVTTTQADIIPNATKRNDGVMTKEQAAELASVITDTDTNIYVSVDGNDNNPGTIDAPLATPDAAFAALPALWNKSMVINFGPGLFTFSGKVISIGACVGPGASPLQVLGTPVSVNDAADAPLNTMTASGGTTDNAVIAPTAATTDGAYRGAYLFNLTNGSRVLITGNTFAGGHTTFNVLLTGGVFTASPGDEFVVEVPGTIFQAAPEESIILGPLGVIGGTASFGMRDIAFQDNPATAVGSNPLLFASGFSFMEAVQVNGGPSFRSFVVIHGSRLNAGSENSFWRDAPIAPYDPARAFAGLYLNSTILAVTDRCSFLGALVADAIFVDTEVNSIAQITSIDADSSNLLVGNNAQLFVTAGSIRNASPFAPGAIWGFNFADIQAGLSSEGLDISNSTADGVNVAFNATVNSGILTGTGNAGAGINVQVCSQAIVNQNQIPGQTTITGVAGDFIIGAATKTYGDLPFTEATNPANATTCTLNRAQSLA